MMQSLAARPTVRPLQPGGPDTAAHDASLGLAALVAGVGPPTGGIGRACGVWQRPGRLGGQHPTEFHPSPTASVPCIDLMLGDRGRVAALCVYLRVSTCTYHLSKAGVWLQGSSRHHPSPFRTPSRKPVRGCWAISMVPLFRKTHILAGRDRSSRGIRCNSSIYRGIRRSCKRICLCLTKDSRCPGIAGRESDPRGLWKPTSASR
jgi:hypothetical protein